MAQRLLTASEVFVNSDNRLGTITSSKRFKQNITPTRWASEVLYELQPVTFQYKKEIDPEGRRQFGLVAEDVEKVNPGLVVRDKEGKPYSVRYDQVNAMLLSEFLKEHKRVEAQQGNHCGVEVNRRATAEGNGGSHGATQRTGCANPESERQASIEQAGAASSRQQTVEFGFKAALCVAPRLIELERHSQGGERLYRFGSSCRGVCLHAQARVQALRLRTTAFIVVCTTAN